MLVLLAALDACDGDGGSCLGMRLFNDCKATAAAAAPPIEMRDCGSSDDGVSGGCVVDDDDKDSESEAPAAGLFAIR